MDVLRAEQEAYRARYELELERRGQISDRADAQVTLVTIFVAVISYYVLNFPHANANWSFSIFIMAFAVLCGGTIVAGICVGRVLWDDKTTYLANPIESHNYYVGIVRREVGADATTGRDSAERIVEDMIYEDYFLAADCNARRNDVRDYCLYWSKRCIFIALAGFLAVAPAHIYLSAAIDASSTFHGTTTQGGQSNG